MKSLYIHSNSWAFLFNWHVLQRHITILSNTTLILSIIQVHFFLGYLLCHRWYGLRTKSQGIELCMWDLFNATSFSFPLLPHSHTALGHCFGDFLLFGMTEDPSGDLSPSGEVFKGDSWDGWNGYEIVGAGDDGDPLSVESKTPLSVTEGSHPTKESQDSSSETPKKGAIIWLVQWYDGRRMNHLILLTNFLFSLLTLLLQLLLLIMLALFIKSDFIKGWLQQCSLIFCQRLDFISIRRALSHSSQHAWFTHWN